MARIYCHGRIVSPEEARISPFDHGFLYGATLFETFRTFGGEPFLLEAHVTRLLAGCGCYGIRPGPELLVSGGPPFERLRAVLRDLLRANGFTDAIFRLTLSAGESPAGLPGTEFDRPGEIVFVRPIPPPTKPAGSISLHILNTHRTEPEVFPRPKSGHYMNSIVGLRELRHRNAAPGDEGLFLTRDGRFAEGVTSNLFLLSERRLRTPPPETGILPGITRNHLLALAPGLGFEVAEEELVPADLTSDRTEAVFITNSVRGLVPVNRVCNALGQPIWQGDSAGDARVLHLIQTLAHFP